MNKGLKNIISRIKGIIPQSLFLIATYGIFMPCSLFLGNINEFAVEFHAILPIVLTISFMMLLLLVLLACVCIKEHIYRIVSGLIFSVAVGFYLQGNFLNPKLNTLNGEQIDWSLYAKNGVISIIAWCTCILLPQILLIKRREITRQVIKWGSYFFAAVQISIYWC